MHVEFDHLSVEKEGRIARITLDRTERLNAFHYDAVRDLDAVSQLLASDQNLRLVTIEGAGRAFCTGIDLKDLSADEIDMSYHPPWERALRRFETMEPLVLCLIHGYALGGGLQLALSCDIRACTPDANLGLPAINESIIPGLGTFRLPRYIGLGRAKRMVILGENVDGEEAERIGLVDHLVSEDGMHEEFEELVDRYTRVNSQGARLSKQAMLTCFDQDFDAFLERYLDLQTEAMTGEDFEEATSAYAEDREPEWS
ncbi:3-hydroxyacyl-CoA dehydrogenase [Halogeometricum pallidum JCM 14848]|uniref:3-hydroxyacyl-CoA dehydrogenase n=1 Tax=Halogeometricum pallidum JCM 14848 TaxID=1227487 RepID=M0DF86_HALPD|nr:enoyl-CoA hydratase/isomerase family protein [Halogeometricum pallidum]ELZ32829.1 3-hydroxyacyl-CoA dehydrogenase [Halogeometricum pallidum JCM 14848]